MPSTRFATQNQAKAIPLVTVSLARGHQRQADNIDRTADDSSIRSSEDKPPYDASQSMDRIRGDNGVIEATSSPSNEDLTQAVLHLSRTLNDQALVQHKKQRKSIQQLTDEQDRLDDDLLNGATEMVPVSMMNTRSIATMEEFLPKDPKELDVNGHLSDDGRSSDDGLRSPRKPRRRIEQYQNPFGTSVSSEDEFDDDNEWPGRGEDQSEEGHTKANSVRLTSSKDSSNRRMPDFTTPSLSPALDPRQSDNENSNTVSSSSSFSSSSFSTSFDHPVTRLSRSRFPSEAGSMTCTLKDPSHGVACLPHQSQHFQRVDSSLSDRAGPGQAFTSRPIPNLSNPILSTSAAFSDFPPTAISTAILLGK
ncbi:hypothetical protein BGZ65_001496 [Modicella reniformis]|uniref:Uncharacterized protein n=1 Tax=Modicella reniformis TaxID=1440133 RepID=A0A9P6ILY4_9FUNG|nr:hypothetical protein BGZ65_001496 [Modicella reniformis]